MSKERGLVGNGAKGYLTTGSSGRPAARPGSISSPVRRWTRGDGLRRFTLLNLVGGKIEILPFITDGLPGQMAPDGLVEILQDSPQPLLHQAGQRHLSVRGLLGRARLRPFLWGLSYHPPAGSALEALRVPLLRLGLLGVPTAPVANGCPSGGSGGRFSRAATPGPGWCPSGPPRTPAKRKEGTGSTGPQQAGTNVELATGRREAAASRRPHMRGASAEVAAS